ncbi:hypothetical protein [Gemmatimonas sp.]|uniref:hypothetical protein n=1 Tax=Gemmatimonas sp. TaxID=1962908 RepID=UPI00333FF154
MTPANAAHIRTVQARIRKLQPDIARAYLRALRQIADLLTTEELEDIVAGRRTFAELFSDESLARATAGYRGAIRQSVQDGARLVVPDLRAQVPRIAAVFNFLDPRVIQAIRALETSAMDTLAAQVREVARAYVENGIRDGKGIPAMARELRTVIGIAPHQERYVDNLARELREMSPRFKDRVLRDKRYDRLILRAIKEGKPLSEPKIAQIASAYTRKFSAYNTEVVTRQITLDSFREANRLSWEQAVADGYVDADSVFKVWVHSGLPKDPRPEHVALNGTAVRYNQPFPNGQQVPGEGQFGCGCSARFEVRPVRRLAAPPRITSRRFAGAAARVGV